jgi:hypothetical protein
MGVRLLPEKIHALNEGHGHSSPWPFLFLWQTMGKSMVFLFYLGCVVEDGFGNEKEDK